MGKMERSVKIGEKCVLFALKVCTLCSFRPAIDALWAIWGKFVQTSKTEVCFH
jgi:hypothetical protein